MARGGRPYRGKGRLPAEMTVFVNRDNDVVQVKRMLSSARLVTLAGVGGAGKTRLAIRVAADIGSTYRDGAWLVDLTAVTDPSWLDLAVAETLEITDRTGRHPADVVIQYVRDRDLLLVLDNCEHLLDACAALAERVLRRAAGVRILCTSRQPLGTPAEHLWEVVPLTLPEQDQRVSVGSAQGYAALALFAARAAAAMSGFALTTENLDTVVDVCQQLDGLPLAIELAAAQLRTRTLDQLATGRDDRFGLLTTRHATPAHHRTLVSTFDWSYALCAPEEQALWARLSIFHGGFPAEAARYVCAPELPETTVVDVLSGLLDKSVLSRAEGSGPARYRLLETVRRYGEDRLRAERDPAPADLARRHRDWYLELARRFERDWFGPRETDWLQQLGQEQGNLRAALDFSLSVPGEAAVGQDLAGCLAGFWYATGRLHEGRYWLRRVLETDARPSRERAHALAGASLVEQAMGDGDRAAGYARELTAIAERLDDLRLRVLADRAWATVTLVTGDLAAAERSFDRALANLAELGENSQLNADLRLGLILVATFTGDLDRAAARCRQSQEICESRGDRFWLCQTLSMAARIALWAGDPDAAGRQARRALELANSVGSHLLIALEVERLGWIAGRTGDHRRAARLLGAADELWRRVGPPRLNLPDLVRPREDCAAAAEAALGAASYAAEIRRGAELYRDEAIRYALGQEAAATPAPKTSLLTPREQQVAELVGEGLSNRQIAARLGTSQRTAESHVENILRKLSFTTRAQVAAWVVQQRG